MRTLGKVCLAALLAGLFAASLRGPAETGDEISILIEPDGSGVWGELIERFERRNPGIDVRLAEGPASTDSRENMYTTAFLSGDDSFDVVFADVIWTPKFAAAGWLLDLTDRVSEEDRADFLPADLQAGYYNGRLYRIPAVTDGAVLYYRADLLADPPETFDDLLADAQRLQTPERWGFLWQGKQYEGLVTVYLEVLWGHGGDWITEDGRVLLDEPEAIEALDFLRGTVGTISPLGVTTYIEDDTRTLFQNGRSVFLRNWFYVWELLEQRDPEFKSQVAFVPMVHAEGGGSASVLGGWGLSISRFSQNADAAWRLIEFLTRPEQLRRLEQRIGLIPARRSMLPDEFQPIIEAARPRPRIPEYAQASDILQRWLSAALSDATDSEEALRQAAEETRVLLGRGAEDAK